MLDLILFVIGSYIPDLQHFLMVNQMLRGKPDGDENHT